METLSGQPRQVREIIVQKSGNSGKIQKIIDLARSHNIKIRFLAEIKIPGAGRVNHQGVAAKISAVATMSIESLLATVRDNENSLIVALDSIQDPHNLGAIIRSSCAAGAIGMIITKDRAAPLGGTAAKVAAGAINKLNICQVTNLAESLKKLKDARFWVYGADATADKTIFESDFSGPVCLVIGSEGAGIRPLVRQQCDFLVKIPMSGPTESLNASVAAGIVLFEVVRQKKFTVQE